MERFDNVLLSCLAVFFVIIVPLLSYWDVWF